MFDTAAIRLDIAEVLRVARASPVRRVWWRACAVEIVLDEEREALIINEAVEVELEWVRVRAPSTGRTAWGPVLARCPRGCGRRARVLWLDANAPEAFPTCRSCAGIEYVTARGNELVRAQVAYDRLRARLRLSRFATHEARPGQHRTTYRRDAARLEKARARLRAAEEQSWLALPYVRRARRARSAG